MVADGFHQYSETGRLRKVIIGRYQGYKQEAAYIELVNENQKKGLPSESTLEREFSAFIRVLKEHHVEVLIPQYVGKFVYDQLTPRDLGVTIGEKFLLCNMANSSRRYESAGIFPHILAMNGNEPTLLIPPENDILIEGGDVIVDKEHIFVGISQRTNHKGFEYLQQIFGERFHVIPVYCRSLSEDENVLHLDCAFNPVGEGHALIYPEGFRKIPEAMEALYTWIPIEQNEQAALATNILSIDTAVVITRDHPDCERVNELLISLGIDVKTLTFDAAPATGGSFRCCSLPLIRL